MRLRFLGGLDLATGVLVFGGALLVAAALTGRRRRLARPLLLLSRLLLGLCWLLALSSRALRRRRAFGDRSLLPGGFISLVVNAPKKDCDYRNGPDRGEYNLPSGGALFAGLWLGRQRQISHGVWLVHETHDLAPLDACATGNSQRNRFVPDAGIRHG